MKFNYITLTLAGVLTLCGLSSCIDDSSTYGDAPIPQLKVDVPDTGDENVLPETNFNLGEECVITPAIVYDGPGTLQYEWSVGTYNNGVKGPLEVVSNERELRYKFEAGGSYYAHLNVTDGIVGFSQDYQVNINRTFEQGYLIVSNSRDNIGNLAFIKDLTPEEKEQGLSPVVMEHCLEAINDGTKPEYLAGVNVLIISWPPPGVTRIIASYGSTSYFLDPNTFMSISTISHDDVIPGFDARFAIGDANVRVYDPAKNRYITLKGYEMMGVEESIYANGNLAFDYRNFFSYEEWGNLNYNNFFVCRSPFSVFFVDYYGNRVDNTMMVIDDEGTPLGYNPFEGHKGLSVFGGMSMVYYFEYYGDIYEQEFYPCCVISRDETSGKYFYTRLRGFGSYDMDMRMESRSEIAVTPNTAIPDEEGAVTLSEKYQRAYYVSGNKVYVMTFNEDRVNLPSTSQAALSYPANEEVTYMTINTDTNELIVATADKSTGRGSLYFYDTADVRTDSPNAPAKAYYPDCADRISFVTYKPRVAD